jgi:phosphate-selective porin OprO and OprP
MGKSFLLTSAAIAAVLTAWPAAAQQPSLEDRIRALEQKLGQPAPGDNQPLEERVKALEDALTQKSNEDQAYRARLSTLEQQVADTVWSFDNSRPTVQSADGRFLMSLRYRLQLDTVLFDQNSGIGSSNAQFKDLNSGLAVRRFYLGAEGRAFRDFWYELRLDFGGSNFETTNPLVNLARVAYNWGNLAYANQPHFRINAGILQPIFTYGDAVSSSSTTFLERADLVNVATAGYGGLDPRHGVELTFQQADIFQPGDNLVISGALTAASGAANPPGAFTATDEGTQILGRAVYRLWSDGFSNVQVGANGSHILSLTGVAAPGGIRTIALQDRPEVRVDGNRLVSTANSTLLGASTSTMNIAETGGSLWGLEGGGNLNNFFLYGEYMKFGMDRNVTCAGCTPFGGTAGVNPGNPEFSGWYVEGSWILTGETKTYSPLATNNEYATFNNPRVITPFDWESGAWGVWEVAARYSDLDLNWNPGAIGQTPAQAPIGGVRGGEEKIWTLGLNWYLNNNVLMRFNYLIIDVNKLGFVTSGGATTLQQIGQNLNAFALRLQYSN